MLHILNNYFISKLISTKGKLFLLVYFSVSY